MLSLFLSGFCLCTVVYVFNFRSFYIPLLMVALDEILVSIPVYLDRVSHFVLLEAPVGMTSCLGSKLRRLGDRRFTALVGWLLF